MSLVNEMLTDLQARRAAGSEPLAGLRAVDGVADARPLRSRAWWPVAVLLLGVAVVVVLWPLREVEPADGAMTQRPAMPAGVATPAAPRPETADPVRVALQDQPADPPVTTPPAATVETVPRVEEPVAVPAPAMSTPPVDVASARPALVAPVDARRPPAPAPAHEAVVERIEKTAVALPQRLRGDGLAALRAGRPVAAAAHFERLTVIEPQNPEPYLLLHAALLAQSRPGAAHAVLSSALEVVPDAAGIARVVGHELLAGERADRAVRVLERHRPADRLDLEYESLLAAAYQQAGHHESATAVYEGLVRRRPANGAWWVGLAISQEASGQVDAARHSFTSARLAGILDDALEAYARERLQKLGTGS